MPKSAKNSQNLPLLNKKIPNFNFPTGSTTRTLEDTQEKILGNFQPKLMTKFEVKLKKWRK